MLQFDNTAPQQIREVDTTRRIVESYPATFGTVVEFFNEIVEPGAFARTIEHNGPEGRNRIKALYQHNPAALVGRPTELTEDEIGLRAVTQFSDTPQARDVLRLIQDEVITEQSIGFDVIKDYQDEDGITHLKEIRLWEYSYVTWGANPQTPIVNVRGANHSPHTIVEKMHAFNKALKHGHFDSDDVPAMLEIAIQQWATMLSNLAGGTISPSTPQSDDPPDGTRELVDALGETQQWLRHKRIERVIQDTSEQIRSKGNAVR